MPEPICTALVKLGSVSQLPRGAEAGSFLSQEGKNFSIAVTHAGAGANSDIIEQLPNLKAICSLGVGFDTIDIKTARKKGILVSNTPDVLNDCVADLAIGLLIDSARRITTGDRYVRAGNWSQGKPNSLGTRVSGKHLGILGMGRIGKAIAERASGFSMDIRYHARTEKSNLPWQYEQSLINLARWSDFLVVACTGGAETSNLVSAEILQALGHEGYLINIARGSVVNQEALIDALKNRTLMGAGIDVFRDEPNVPEELFALDNVVLAPHIGSATRETRSAMADLVVANVEKFIANGALVSPC